MAHNQNQIAPNTSSDVSERELTYGLELYQGPLPHARDFAAYEKVLPGAARRILILAERDQTANIALRWANWLTDFMVMLLGRVFLYTLVAAAFYLAIHDKPFEALLAGLAPIVVAIYANTRRATPAKGDNE